MVSGGRGEFQANKSCSNYDDVPGLGESRVEFFRVLQSLQAVDACRFRSRAGQLAVVGTSREDKVVLPSGTYRKAELEARSASRNVCCAPFHTRR